MKTKRLQYLCWATALLFALVTGPAIKAADTTASLTGTWKVTFIHDGKRDAYQPNLKLKADGEKLTGTLDRNTGTKIETLPVEAGKIKGADVSFDIQFYSQVYKNGVLQSPNTNNMSHWKFQGTLGGATIKGTVEKESSAGRRTQNWEARRVAE